MCELCLERFVDEAMAAAKNQKSSAGLSTDLTVLLKPDRQSRLCSLCFRDLCDGSACPARCRHCLRLYCEVEAATCANDSSSAKSTQTFLTEMGMRERSSGKALEQERKVALISCIYCVGRPTYLENRTEALRNLARKVGLRGLRLGDPLAIPSSFEIKRENIKAKSDVAHALGDMVYDLYYGGFREVFTKGLDFLLRIVSTQISLPVLSPAISPFNFLYFMEQHPLANEKMLEKLCRAHAICATKTAEDLVRRIGDQLPPLIPLHDGSSARKRVAFYAENMFKEGPLSDLAVDTLIFISRHYDVVVVGVGSDYNSSDSLHPPVKKLWEHFPENARICFKQGDGVDTKVKVLRGLKLDVFVSLQGWTGNEDVGPILAVRVAPVQLNWLEWASPLYGSGLVCHTIVGSAVGDGQRKCVERERLGVFKVPGCYQPAQSRSLVDAASRQPPKGREFFGLPADNFILLLPGSTNRLKDEAAVYRIFALMRRIPGMVMVFINRPATMQSFILKCLDEDNAGQDTRSKVDPSRLIFRDWMHNKLDWYLFIRAVGHEGGRGACICSLGPVCFHTGASDAFMNLVPYFGWSNKEGAMPQRVAAEIATSCGLAWPCVSDTLDGALDAVLAYANDRILQDRMLVHMTKAYDEELGYYGRERVAEGLIYAVDTSYSQVCAANGEWDELQDFEIPFVGRPVEALAPDPVAVSAQQKRLNLLNDAGVGLELLDCGDQLLQGILEDTGGTLHEVVGGGASSFAIRASFPGRPDGVIKMSKEGCKQNRLHNRPLYREAKVLSEWPAAMRHHEFLNIVPAPYKVLKGGTSFFGHSLPNESGDVLCFLICEHITLNFWDVAGEHQNQWQQRGVLHDSFRIKVLQPMCQLLFWSQYNDQSALIIRDWKPDNLRVRPDGSWAVVDLGDCATFSHRLNKRGVHFVERRATSMCLDVAKAAKAGKCALLRSRQSRPGDKYVAISQSDLEQFASLLGDKGLALIGGTTPGFRDDMQRKKAAESRGLRLLVGLFDMKSGIIQDNFAFFRTVLYILTHKPGASTVAWDADANEAASHGADGIKRMLLDAAPRDQMIQQPEAFARLVDLLAGGLHVNPEERWNSKEALVHECLTLAMLTPEQELGLSSPTGLPFRHGPVRESMQLPPGFLDSLSPSVRFKVENTDLSKLAYKIQGKMNGGVMAEEDIDGGALLGVYVGNRVRNHSIGTVYDSRNYPSRFTVTGQGNLKIFKQLGTTDCKFTCDAQGTLCHDFEFCRSIGNSGPFMNAAASEELANCKVDRHSAWYDAETGLIWMLVWAKAAGIKKGAYCLWYYMFEAGAGQLWNFKPRCKPDARSNGGRRGAGKGGLHGSSPPPSPPHGATAAALGNQGALASPARATHPAHQGGPPAALRRCRAGAGGDGGAN